MSALARSRESLQRTVGIEAARSVGRGRTTLGRGRFADVLRNWILETQVPESHTTLEVLEIVPTDDDFLRRRPTLPCKRTLALRCLKDLVAEGVKIGC